MTKNQSRAYRLRWLILIAGVLYTAVALASMILPFFQDYFVGLWGTPLAPMWLLDDAPWESWALWVNLVMMLGLLLLSQWALLRPGRGWTIRVATVARPMKSAVIAAGFMAALLTSGLIALVLELPDWWSPITNHEEDSPGGAWSILGIWCGILLAWSVWAWVFFVYWEQGDRYTQMGRMIRVLVSGSLLEIFVAIPVHIWATRQRECYCARGTYTTLVFAGLVLLLAFGPGIVLLFMREWVRREKLLWGEPYACPKCGYDLRGTTPREACPECGTMVSERNQGSV